MAVQILSITLLVVGMLGQILAFLNWWLTRSQKERISDVYVEIWVWLDDQDFGTLLRAILSRRNQIIVAVVVGFTLGLVGAELSWTLFMNGLLFSGIGAIGTSYSTTPTEDFILGLFILGIPLFVFIGFVVLHVQILRFFSHVASIQVLFMRFLGFIALTFLLVVLLQLDAVIDLLSPAFDHFVGFSFHRLVSYVFMLESAVLVMSLLVCAGWIALVQVGKVLAFTAKLVIEKTLASGSGPVAGLTGFLVGIGLLTQLLLFLAADETKQREVADESDTPAEAAAAGKAEQDEEPAPDAAAGAPVQVTDSTFEAKVLNSPLPVLVDFWAEWSGPNKRIAPVVADLARDLSGKVTVAKLNIDDNPMTPTKYGVRGIPTLMLFKDGQVAAARVGVVNESQLYTWLEKNLGDGVDVVQDDK